MLTLTLVEITPTYNFQKAFSFHLSYTSCILNSFSAIMSSDAVKKRKSKVLRGEGATPEMKRGRVEGDQQVTRTRRIKADLLRSVWFWMCGVNNQ